MGPLGKFIFKMKELHGDIVNENAAMEAKR